MNIFIPKTQFRFLQSENDLFLIVADCIDITKVKPICLVVAFVLLQTVIRSQISEEKTNHSFMKRGCGGVKDRSVFSWKFIQFAEYSRPKLQCDRTWCTSAEPKKFLSASVKRIFHNFHNKDDVFRNAWKKQFLVIDRPVLDRIELILHGFKFALKGWLALKILQPHRSKGEKFNSWNWKRMLGHPYYCRIEEFVRGTSFLRSPKFCHPGPWQVSSISSKHLCNELEPFQLFAIVVGNTKDQEVWTLVAKIVASALK